MTNEKEAPEWWMDDEYWEEGMDYKGYYSYDPKIEKIVAEAERRGERKAFRSIRDFLDRKDSDTISKSDIYGICQEN